MGYVPPRTASLFDLPNMGDRDDTTRHALKNCGNCLKQQAQWGANR